MALEDFGVKIRKDGNVNSKQKDNYADSQHVDDQNRDLYTYRIVLAIFLTAIAVAPILHWLGISV